MILQATPIARVLGALKSVLRQTPYGLEECLICRRSFYETDLVNGVCGSQRCKRLDITREVHSGNRTSRMSSSLQH